MPRKFLSRIDEAYLNGAKLIEYKLPCKIGFWDENLALKEEKMALICAKRARCETLTIRRNIMLENLHKPGKLPEPNKYIHYGDAIQITTDKLQTEQLGIPPSVLASIITEKDIEVTVNLCHGCPVVASTYQKPCRRNLFTIIHSKDPNKTGKRALYGSDVYICIHDSGSDRRLYVQALVPTYDDFGGPNDHYPLRLCECPDRYCKFKLLHHNPELRDVVNGDDIFSNTTLCIAHSVTNRFLVTENTYVPTLFGSEMEVSCYVYKENNRETVANHWELAIQKQKELIKPNTK